MDIQALKSLIDLFSQAPLQELDVSDGVQTLRITRGTAGHAVASGATPPPAPHSPAKGEGTQH
ncbi:MAG: hypothetical protein ABF636_10755, partial [Acetobacter sp.]